MYCLEIHFMFPFTIFHSSLFGISRDHNISIDERNNVANAKELIAVINEDSLTEAKATFGEVFSTNGGRRIARWREGNHVWQL